ncbi:MAG: ribosomal RNA small subunit methyltransferase G [Cyclobacteriaceae bacterium]|nr:MAG: ribosomal RNA small subunit methyltransferase G [Cyclobacteriaceae bacterium]
MEFDPGPQIIFQYFDALDSIQKNRFVQLGTLYHTWNQRINLISRKDMVSFYQNHVLHALGIAKIRAFKPADTVLDVGTGGGFPGIPLAILFPETRFHLIDSIGKKIAVVDRIIHKLELTNATCQKVRAEQVDGSYTYVVCKAVARLNKLLPWVEHSLVTGGKVICLKGGDLKAEIREVKNKVQSYQLSDYFQEPYFDTKKVLEISIK